MRMNRRAALRAGCLGAGAVLAGCLGGDGERVPTESPPISVLTVTDSETVGFAVRGAVGWEGPGYVVVVDSEERQRSLLTKYGIPNDRRDRVLGFLDGIDYASERLVLVESVGPDSCHDELEIGDVGVDDEGIRATATVGRESDADEGCREVLTYPSSLLRVAFEGEPPDRAVVDMTDGRDASSSVAASVEDSLSPAPEDLPGRVRPDDEPDPVAPLSCDRAGVERHDQWFDEDDRQWGDYDDGGTTTLALRVDDLTYDRGDTLNASLTNVAEEPVETGNSSKYNIQVLTEEGWQDLRVIDAAESFAYTDEAVSHGPGEGFDWSIELTEEGIIGSSVQEDAEVCPDLQSGRHRLAYFGVDDGAVAVGFELEM